jgi:hypothetical protein
LVLGVSILPAKSFVKYIFLFFHSLDRKKKIDAAGAQHERQRNKHSTLQHFLMTNNCYWLLVVQSFFFFFGVGGVVLCVLCCVMLRRKNDKSAYQLIRLTFTFSSKLNYATMQASTTEKLAIINTVRPEKIRIPNFGTQKSE